VTAAARAESEIAAWLDAFARDPTFLEAYPYYAAILGKLTPVADLSVSRMAVSLHDGRFFLHVNVESFMAEPQYLRGVLLHEVHHVVLGHLTHPKFADVDEPELMDLAIEMSANEHIEEPLPNPITWRAYAACGVRPGQSTIERYDALVAHTLAAGSRPRPAPGSGGEKATHAIDDHRFLRRGENSPGGVVQNALLVKHAIIDAPDPPPGERGDRGRGAAPRRWLVAGRTPGRLVEELTGTTLEPESFIDWRAALQMFVARARSPVHTWSRPSRRFRERPYEVPGRTWAPRRVDEPRLLVAIDTSLSMTLPELEEAARQLRRLAERAHLVIAECDVEITRVYPFAGTLDRVSGRGGTDLRPIFEPQVLGAHNADGVVYFTDGEGPFPEHPAPVPTLWVLTKPHAFRCPWGERAWLAQRSRSA
jgi:predicted metal-dependent peptidase